MGEQSRLCNLLGLGSSAMFSFCMEPVPGLWMLVNILTSTSLNVTYCLMKNRSPCLASNSCEYSDDINICNRELNLRLTRAHVCGNGITVEVEWQITTVSLFLNKLSGTTKNKAEAIKRSQRTLGWGTGVMEGTELLHPRNSSHEPLVLHSHCWTVGASTSSFTHLEYGIFISHRRGIVFSTMIGDLRHPSSSLNTTSMSVFPSVSV